MPCHFCVKCDLLQIYRNSAAPYSFRTAKFLRSPSHCIRPASTSVAYISGLERPSRQGPRQAKWPLTSPARHMPQSPFSTSPYCLKRGGKQESKRNVENAQTKSADVDPFDLSAMEAGIHKAQEKLKDDLSKLKPGGRFNTEIIENLRVPLMNQNRGKSVVSSGKGDKEKDKEKEREKEKVTVRLGDLAQVIPRSGRLVVVLVGEEEVNFLLRPSTSIIQKLPRAISHTPPLHPPLHQYRRTPPPPSFPPQSPSSSAIPHKIKKANTLLPLHTARQTHPIKHCLLPALPKPTTRAQLLLLPLLLISPRNTRPHPRPNRRRPRPYPNASVQGRRNGFPRCSPDERGAAENVQGDAYCEECEA